MKGERQPWGVGWVKRLGKEKAGHSAQVPAKVLDWVRQRNVTRVHLFRALGNLILFGQPHEFWVPSV